MVNFFANSGFKLSSIVSVRPYSFHPPRSSAVNMTTNGSDLENVSALRRFLHETTNSTFELFQIFTFESLSDLSQKDSGFWRVKSFRKIKIGYLADEPAPRSVNSILIYRIGNGFTQKTRIQYSYLDVCNSVYYKNYSLLRFLTFFIAFWNSYEWLQRSKISFPHIHIYENFSAKSIKKI